MNKNPVLVRKSDITEWRPAMKRILLINYSIRKDGNCSKFLSHIKKRLSNNNIIETSNLNDEFSNKCGNCNYECFSGKCKWIDDNIYCLWQKVLSSDIIIHIFPIYCGLPCSNFFVFSERIQGAFHNDEFYEIENKHNMYIVVGNDGKEITQNIIQVNNSKFENNDLLFISSHDVGEKSIKGNLVEHEYYKKKIDSFLQSVEL